MGEGARDFGEDGAAVMRGVVAKRLRRQSVREVGPSKLRMVRDFANRLLSVKWDGWIRRYKELKKDHGLSKV